VKTNTLRTVERSGFKRDELRGDWRKLQNEGLHDCHLSPNIIQVVKSRRMGWTGHVARMGKRRGAYRLLVGKHEEKRPLGRPRHIRKDDILMDRK
jgi:CelD/BcsL family acetyltransferase involved in cellulose biosynthesis